jgi:hypothetical protein
VVLESVCWPSWLSWLSSVRRRAKSSGRSAFLVRVDVEDEDDDLAEYVAGVVQEEARKFAAAAANRLELEGVSGIEMVVEDSDDVA